MYIKIKDICIEAVKSGGEILIEYYYNRNFLVKEKSMRADFVTTVDKKVQEVIVEIISKHFPHVNIVAEEKDNVSSNSAFYIDPLDGTLNFIHKFPVFAISIGYWENGDPKVGVVYNPITGELYWAVEGRGAYLNGEKINVSKVDSLGKSLLVTGWPYNRNLLDKVLKDVEGSLKKSQEIRSLGSAALECCYVARGFFDGYWEWALSSWDLAAGVLIAKEAGAKVSGIDGREFILEEGNIILSNPFIHDELVLMLGDKYVTEKK